MLLKHHDFTAVWPSIEAKGPAQTPCEATFQDQLGFAKLPLRACFVRGRVGTRQLASCFCLALPLSVCLHILLSFRESYFGGNSSHCIKRRPFKDTAAIRYPPDARARGVWPSEPLRSVLLALGFVTARNTGRILMQHAA
jgi:hypothetical protein